MSTITIPAPRGLAGATGAILGRLPRWVWGAAILLLAMLCGAWLFTHSRASGDFITAPVTQTTLVSSVTASGTVNPQNLISVGTQVSGTIASISVDYNSKVKRGQVLARLDPGTFEAQLAQARAAVAQAQAQVSQAAASANGAASGVGAASATAASESAAVAAAKANVGKTQAALGLAEKTAARDSALLALGYIAQSSVDIDRANVAQDESDVAAAQAAVAQAQAENLAGNATVSQDASTAQSQVASTQAAQANVAAAQAVVRQDELNLEHGVITSPVDGTVVARDVSVGQTVAASLQTPTLFSIAQNLAKMEIDINVAEPDIGNVKPGNPVSFSVLAYPNETFQGTVAQVRINPQTLNNVVTYDVVVFAQNAGGKLLPGMTANASIQVASVRDALTVPVAALHTSTPASTAWGSVGDSSGSGAVATGSKAQLLIIRDGKPTRVPVYVRLTNGTQAAVQPLQGGTLSVGDQVVIGTKDGKSRNNRTPSQSARSPMSTAPMGGGTRGIH